MNDFLQKLVPRLLAAVGKPLADGRGHYPVVEAQNVARVGKISREPDQAENGVNLRFFQAVDVINDDDNLAPGRLHKRFDAGFELFQRHVGHGLAQARPGIG